MTKRFDDGKVDPNAGPSGPEWLRKQLGDDFFDDVVSVQFTDVQVSDVSRLAALTSRTWQTDDGEIWQLLLFRRKANRNIGHLIIELDGEWLAIWHFDTNLGTACLVGTWLRLTFSHRIGCEHRGVKNESPIFRLV